MRPAFSVVLLTTLIGAGQGLFLTLYAAECLALLDLWPAQASFFYVGGSVLALAFLGAGLAASFFHLGHPERAWRAASMWRTSWLSREVIVLPLTMALITLYGLLHWLDADGWTPLVGGLGVLATLTLFLCTGMIYACIRFLPEWATPLTVVNYAVLGIGSGLSLATAFAAHTDSLLTYSFAVAAMVATGVGLVTRSLSLVRNARLKPASSLATAIGVKHSRIAQTSQGFMGGSFNTREFFHGVPAGAMGTVRWGFLVLAFGAPLVLLGTGLHLGGEGWFLIALLVQLLGLVVERWYFFADANHAQNIYYQTVG